MDEVDCQEHKEALLNRDIVKDFWTLLAGGAFYIHPTARNHDELDVDGFFPEEVRAVKAQYAHVYEDNQMVLTGSFYQSMSVMCPIKIAMHIWLALLLSSLVLDTLVL